MELLSRCKSKRFLLMSSCYFLLRALKNIETILENTEINGSMPMPFCNLVIFVYKPNPPEHIEMYANDIKVWKKKNVLRANMKSNYITCWQFLCSINISHHFSLDWNSLYYQKYLHYQMEKRSWSFQSTSPVLYTPVAACFLTIPSCSVFTALELIWHLAVCNNCLCDFT